MFPTDFDKDNQLFANTRFGDFPHYLPTKKWINKDELLTVGQKYYFAIE